MSKRPKFADVASVWVTCKSGTVAFVHLELVDGSTFELSGAAMFRWLDAWLRLCAVPPSPRTGSSRCDSQTSMRFGRSRSGETEA